MTTEISTRAHPEYVTGRAFDPLVKYGDGQAWDQEELVEGLPVTEEELRDPRSKISWDVFVRYAERVETKMGGAKEIGKLGDVLVPSFSPMAKFVGFFASPSTIYGVINRWGGPSMFPPVSGTSRDLDGDRIEIRLSIPAELRGSSTFLRITGVMFRMAPCLVGGRPALVEEDIGTHEARYVVHLPPSSTLWARVIRAFRAFFSGSGVLNELVNQHDRLIASHNELRATHAELVRSEENFRSLIEQTPLGVIVAADDVILYANEGAHDFLRLDEDQSLVTRRLSNFMKSGDALPGAPSSIEAAGVGSELEFVTLTDETVVGETKQIPIEWDGRHARLFVIADVTERNRVMDRALQLDRIVAIGTLAAGVAHEINNPLAFVHSNLEYSLEALAEVEGQVEAPQARRLREVRSALEESVNGTSRTRNIVKDMKAMSREPDEARVPVDVRDVVRSAINMGWHEVRTRAKLRTEYEDVPEILGNAGRLGQVVLNLVVNAAQAMDPENKEHNFITIRTRAEEERGVIEVEDNGPGISPENLRRIFDPFFTTKPLGEGTGLGLWISSSIIARFGGKLEVESEVGRGTLFRVSLPYALEEDAEGPPELDVETPISHPRFDEAPGTESPPRRPSYHRSGAIRVLAIDDEAMILRLVNRVLPHEVVAYGDPHEAMRHLRDDDDFDVVLCDATMPGLNGYEVLVRLRAEYPELAERFVLVTGGLTTSWEKDERVPEILSKPFDMQLLRDTVLRIAATRQEEELSKPPTLH